MILEVLLNRIPVLEISGSKTLEISEIVFDSRKAVENSLYVAVKGTVSDGHSFIDAAIEKGDTGQHLFATFEDGLREMQLCDAIVRSAKEDRWVRVEG